VRCRGVRIFALLAIAACTNAPASPRDAAPAETRPSVDPWANTIVIVDPWANTLVDAYAVKPWNPVLFTLPFLDGPARTELAIDPTPGQRVSAVSDAIDLLAVTADGGAAVTVDIKRSARLWPTLDGKREPLVISLPAPSMLAITREGDAFAIASVDTIGQLQIATLTNTAEVTRRVDVGLARPIVALHASASGFVALRDDRVVSILDSAGVVRAELATDPGAYVASIAVQGDRALAFVEADDVVRGRWIDLPTATWRESTNALPFPDGDGIALSPDHGRVAGRHTSRSAIVEVALASGKVIATHHDVGTDTRVIGYRTRSLVVGGPARSWIVNDNTTDLFGPPFAFAKGRLFSGVGSAIAIYAADSTAYVGYRMSHVMQIVPRGRGLFASDGVSLVELDAAFKTRAAFEIADVLPRLTQITIVDGDHALGSTYMDNRGLYLMSTTQKTTTLVSPLVNHFSYEPATRLLHYHREGFSYVARFDPKARAFGPAVEIARDGITVVLLDPTHANSDEIALVRSEGNSTFRAELGRLNGETFTRSREQTFEPSQSFFDAGGDPRTLVRKDRVRSTSPDGANTAEIREGRIELREGKTLRWRVPNPGAFGVMWTPQGELLAYGAGLAKIDLATGVLRDRQCGAWFGRWDAVPDASGSSLMCEVQ
jgi:hypothetical protein